MPPPPPPPPPPDVLNSAPTEPVVITREELQPSQPPTTNPYSSPHFSRVRPDLSFLRT